MLFPKITVDGIIRQDSKILLICRKNEPFKGEWALPGGFVEYGETTEDAVIREIQEETGFITKITDLVGVYSNPARDPRGHTISIVYSLDIIKGNKKAGSDADKASFFSILDLPFLAFDHEQIIKDAISNVR